MPAIPLDSPTFFGPVLTIFISASAYVINSEYRARWLLQTVQRHEETLAILQAEQASQGEALSAISATLDSLKSAMERIDAKLDRLSERGVH